MKIKYHKLGKVLDITFLMTDIARVEVFFEVKWQWSNTVDFDIPQSTYDYHCYRYCTSLTKSFSH